MTRPVVHATPNTGAHAEVAITATIDAAYGLGGSKDGSAVDEGLTHVKRVGKKSSQQLLCYDRRAVGDCHQQDELEHELELHRPVNLRCYTCRFVDRKARRDQADAPRSGQIHGVIAHIVHATKGRSQAPTISGGTVTLIRAARTWYCAATRHGSLEQ